MVNFAVALTSASVIGGVVIYMALWAYEEYQRSQRRHRYDTSPSNHDNSNDKSSSARARAPPQPTNDCIICHDALKSPLEVLPCGHLFHRSCIRKWFERRMLCPLCRAPIPQQMVNIYKRRLGL